MTRTIAAGNTAANHAARSARARSPVSCIGQTVEQRTEDECGGVADHDQGDGGVVGEDPAEPAPEEREQREEAQRALRERVVAVQRDVAVERGVPREQALGELDRPRAAADLAEHEAGDGERAAHEEAGDHPRDDRGPQVAPHEAAAESTPRDVGHGALVLDEALELEEVVVVLHDARGSACVAAESALPIASHLPSTLWYPGASTYQIVWSPARSRALRANAAGSAALTRSM